MRKYFWDGVITAIPWTFQNEGSDVFLCFRDSATIGVPYPFVIIYLHQKQEKNAKHSSSSSSAMMPYIALRILHYTQSILTWSAGEESLCSHPSIMMSNNASANVFPRLKTRPRPSRRWNLITCHLGLGMTQQHQFRNLWPPVSVYLFIYIWVL